MTISNLSIKLPEALRKQLEFQFQRLVRVLFVCNVEQSNGFSISCDLVHLLYIDKCFTDNFECITISQLM